MQSESFAYEKLVEEYEASLTTVLRGFRPSLDFVDSWVPDSNLVSSLLNLLDAAQIAGRKRLALDFSASTLEGLSPEALVKELKSGAPSVEINATQSEGRVFLSFALENELDTSLKVNAVYQKAIDRYRQLNAGAKVLAEPKSDDQAIVSAEVGGAKLSVLVDKKSGFIRDAAYGGDFSQEQKGALEAYCELLPRLNLLEARDHGAIRLEFLLRDKTQPRPVAGIVTVRNAGPIFELCQALSRKLWDVYHDKYRPAGATAGSKLPGNFFDLPVSASWKELTKEQKLEKAKEVIRQLGPSVGVHEGDYELTHVDHEVRLFGTYPSELPSGEKGRRLMRLEAELKEKLDSRIQLFQEEIKDLNSKRRL